MKTPKYTDLLRYPNGWRSSRETNVADTWAKAREQIEKLKQERAEKVRNLKQIGKR